jgi:hypothetical protein
MVVFVARLTLRFFFDTFSEGKRLLLNSIDQASFRPYLAWHLTPIAVEIVGLLWGGILGSCRQGGSNRLQTSSPEREFSCLWSILRI